MQNYFSSAVIAFIALLHIYILVLEMFLWDTSRGRRVFGQSAEQAAASKVLAANQGLYNGFLAAGLFWGLYLGTAGFDIKVFFLSCVLVAGIYGGFTAKRKILWIQGAPALAALVLLLIRTLKTPFHQKSSNRMQLGYEFKCPICFKAVHSISP